MRRRWSGEAPVVLWALALALLVLGPALGPGFLLVRDMVWVPDLALRADSLGLGSGLPRAVPSDAVVAVLDEVVPGMLLQKLVLVLALAAGGVGAARLLDRGPQALVVRLVAVTVYGWNALVAERLLMGALAAARRVRRAAVAARRGPSLAGRGPAARARCWSSSRSAA